MKIWINLIACIFTSSILGIEVNAQESSLLKSLPEEEKNAVEAVALYPKEQRQAILEVSKYPEILVRVQNIQNQSILEFKETISKLSENDQKKMYDLTRYPDLMNELTKGNKKKSSGEVDDILTNYPDEIHENARYINKKYFKELSEISDLHQKSENQFNNLIQAYPEELQESFQKLIQLPEIITILSENMSATVLLGDIYKRNPQQLEKELDSLNVVLAERKSKEFNEWKENLENDPEAKAEFEKASKEFAKDQGYNEINYGRPSTTTNVYVNYVWHPYPYWFGWPWWYDYPCWYPYPWWYHWGFYYGPGSTLVFIGFPSNFYMHWHFSHYRYFYHYPHFTNHVIRHYHAYPRSHTSISRTVRNWEKNSRTELPRNWMDNDKNRVNRIQELGKFKMDHENVKKVQNQAPNERDYLRSNAKTYPTLRPALKEKPGTVYKEPQTKITQGQRNTNTLPTNKRPNVTFRKPNENVGKTRQSPTQYEQINKAKNYHQNSWEKTNVPRNTPKSYPTPTKKPQQIPSGTPTRIPPGNRGKGR